MIEKEHEIRNAELNCENGDTFYDVTVEMVTTTVNRGGHPACSREIGGVIEFTHSVPDHLLGGESTPEDWVAEHDNAIWVLKGVILTGQAGENTIEFVANDYDLEVYPDEPDDDIQNLDEMETRAISELSGLIGEITDGGIDILEVEFQRNYEPSSYMTHRPSGPSELTIKYNE